MFQTNFAYFALEVIGLTEIEQRGALRITSLVQAGREL